MVCRVGFTVPPASDMPANEADPQVVSGAAGAAPARVWRLPRVKKQKWEGGVQPEGSAKYKAVSVVHRLRGLAAC